MIREFRDIPDLDLDFYPSRIPDPGVKKAPDPGSGSATLNPPLPTVYTAEGKIPREDTLFICPVLFSKSCTAGS
jgi:hypothetical protein